MIFGESLKHLFRRDKEFNEWLTMLRELGPQK